MQQHTSRSSCRRHEPKVEPTGRFGSSQTSFSHRQNSALKIAPAKPHEYLDKNLNGRGDMASLLMGSSSHLDNYDRLRKRQQSQMDNIRPSVDPDIRRQLKAAPLMQRDYYTQIDCLPGPCVEIYHQESGQRRPKQNTSQILKDQYVWRSGANLPGNSYRVPQDYSAPKKRSRPNTADLHKSTPELENQQKLRPQRNEGVKNYPFQVTAQQNTKTQAISRPARPPNFWTTKKNPEKNDSLYRGGLSGEIDMFYHGKKTLQARRDLYKSNFQIQ